MTPPRSSLAALLAAYSLGTFSDWFIRALLVSQILRPLPYELNGDRWWMYAFIVVPIAYLLLGPIGGVLADFSNPRSVLKWGVGIQLVIQLLIWAAALFGKTYLIPEIGMVALAVLTALTMPAWRTLVTEATVPDRLARGVGWMEALGLVAASAGLGIGALVSERGGFMGNVPSQLGCMAMITGFAWVLLRGTTVAGNQALTPWQWRKLRTGLDGLALIWRDQAMRRAALALTLFPATLCLHPFQFSIGQGVCFAIAALFAGYFSRRGVEIGLAPIGGAILVGTLVVQMLIPPGIRGAAYAGWCAIAFACGLFVVPLLAYLQQRAGPGQRGGVQAGAGVLMAVVFLLVHALEVWLDSDLHLQLIFTGTALAMLLYGVWHIPHHTVCTVMRLIGPIFYRVKSRGQENIPAGGALMICNHLSYVDAVVLQIASPRTIRFIAFAGFAKNPFLRFVFRAAGVIPVTPNKPMKGIRLAWDAIKAGELVCVFPEGAISRTGQLMQLKRGFGLIAEGAKVPVIPTAIDGLWGSIYSFAGNKYLWKSPRLMPTDVWVIFGKGIPPDQAGTATARRALLDLGEEAFQERPVLKRHLGREAVRALAKNPRHTMVIDRTAERRALSSAEVLAAAATLSRRLRATVSDARIGIVLPPGAGAFIANLAISCAGKIPVNLNFTTGRASLEASMRLGEINVVITADAMRSKVPNFPFPERTLDLKKEIEAAGGKRALLPWLLAAYVLPNQWVADLLGLPRTGDGEEAALLFTSGSSGEPKGVVLSHRNILANCAQISSLSILPESALLLGCLPVFHSFGFTVTLWYPVLRGCGVATVPSPLDTRKIVETIQQEKVSVLLGAPTFVRPILKRATKEELSALRLVVTGAEKLPMDLYDAFVSQFGIEILQGYGLTETTPVASINQYDPPITTSTAERQEGKRVGAVGRLLPGMTARIVDPDTGNELPLTSVGTLWVKGPNIFTGYLKDEEKTSAALKDGWFVTGDLARFDDDGFLHIEGRLSRFSKIGGEMVPHGTVEHRIVSAFGWEQHDGLVAVIVGVPDSAKGEALVLLTTQDITAADVRTKLLEAGLPNLWVPKQVCKVDQIPVLGTGKTDLKACRTIALEKAAER